MNQSTVSKWLMLAGVLILVFCYSYLLGVSDTRNKAIKANAGRFAVNPQTGQTSFVWGAN